jgi:hypothetical protein
MRFRITSRACLGAPLRSGQEIATNQKLSKINIYTNFKENLSMEAAAETNTPTLLHLDQPRVLAIRDGKFPYIFHFRRITLSDWERYYSSIFVSSRNEGGAQLNTTDNQTAGIDLLESTLMKVVGYKTDLTTKEAFIKIPPRHSILVSNLLCNVTASEEDDEKPFDTESIETRMDAMWSQLEPGQENTVYKGLVHRLSPPTAAQKKRYMRNGSISKVVGGSRKGTTIYSMRNKLMMELYDELIQSVDGYGVAGRPLGSVDEIRREMDGYHKSQAIFQLFNGSDAQPQAAEDSAA